MKLRLVGITVFFSFLAVATVRAKPAAPEANCTSTSAGDWNVIDRWSCGHVPDSTDDVIVNHAVALNTEATILSLTISGTLTFDNNSMSNHTLTVLGNITINSSGVIDISTSGPQRTHALSIGGNFTNAGTFAGVSSKGNRVINTTFAGTGLQTIGGSGTTDFNNLTIGTGARVGFPAASIPTVEGTLNVNTGGAVQQTLTVESGTVSFLQISDTANVVKYRGVELTPTVGALGSTTVVVTTTISGGCTTLGSPPNYATRCYSITPTNNVTATVKLWALTATQLNGIPQASLRIYHYTGDAWQQLSNSINGSDAGAYSYAQGTTPGFSAFLLGDARPTAVALSAFHAQPQTATGSLPIGLGFILSAILLALKRRAR